VHRQIGVRCCHVVVVIVDDRWALCTTAVETALAGPGIECTSGDVLFRWRSWSDVPFRIDYLMPVLCGFLASWTFWFVTSLWFFCNRKRSRFEVRSGDGLLSGLVCYTTLLVLLLPKRSDTVTITRLQNGTISVS
jgi:hypothetical protein